MLINSDCLNVSKSSSKYRVVTKSCDRKLIKKHLNLMTQNFMKVSRNFAKQTLVDHPSKILPPRANNPQHSRFAHPINTKLKKNVYRYALLIGHFLLRQGAGTLLHVLNVCCSFHQKWSKLDTFSVQGIKIQDFGFNFSIKGPSK
jgi:hypothetical protein